MRHATHLPVITVPQDVYDAILLAERALVVAEGQRPVAAGGSRLADFSKARQCLMTAGDEAGLRAPDQAALLRCMVGG